MGLAGLFSLISSGCFWITVCNIKENNHCTNSDKSHPVENTVFVKICFCPAFLACSIISGHDWASNGHFRYNWQTIRALNQLDGLQTFVAKTYLFRSLFSCYVRETLH